MDLDRLKEEVHTKSVVRHHNSRTFSSMEAKDQVVASGPLEEQTKESAEVQRKATARAVWVPLKVVASVVREVEAVWPQLSSISFMLPATS